MASTPVPYLTEVSEILQDHYGLVVVDTSRHLTSTTAFCAKLKCQVKGSNEEKVVTCKLVDQEGLKILGYFYTCGPRIQTAVMDNLWKSGFQCCRPVLTLEGKAYCEAVPKDLMGQKVTLVLEYIPGTSLNQTDITLDTLEEVGELMAQVELAVKTMKVEDCPQWSPEKVLGNSDGQVILDNLSYFENEDQRELMREFQRTWKSVLQQAINTHGIGLIHGDFQIGNIIAMEGKQDGGLSPKEKYGLIDFDAVHYNVTLSAFANSMATVGNLFLPEGLTRDDVWARMLVGYTKVIKLSKPQLEFVYYSILYLLAFAALYTSKDMKEQHQKADLYKEYIGGYGNDFAREQFLVFSDLFACGSDQFVEKWMKVINKETSKL